MSHIANGALASGAATVTFPDRYQYIEIKNQDTAGSSDLMYVKTDGTTPVSPWDDCYPVAAQERILVPNGAQLWYQGYGGMDGTSANPGTTVKIVSTNNSSTAEYSVVGTG